MHQSKFRRTPLAAGIALALGTAAPNPVVAQDTAPETAVPEELEEIVVTGIRSSLTQSMDIKRDAIGVVGAVSAEDIGNFPDANLGESLQRITGVSIDRQRGEGSRVTVRGFGPEYNLVTINGRQMPTHNGVTRSFDFADLASEGVAGVQVYKTGRADVPSGGIGSTINILTPKPLTGQRTLSLAAKAVMDTSTRTGDEVTPEVSGIYLDRFMDDTHALRMACGSSTLAYCWESETNKVWDNFNNKGYEVADAFIDGLQRHSWNTPLCITTGGFFPGSTPLSDSTFQNVPNPSGPYFHIQYLSNFASTAPTIHIPHLPELIPVYELIPPPLPDPIRKHAFVEMNGWMYAREEVKGRGPAVKINRSSGAVYLFGGRRFDDKTKPLEEKEYLAMARRSSG